MFRNIFEKRLDFVGLGDAVIDTFIELEDAWIETDNPEGKEELCMRFGDKIPYSSEVTVYGTGNAANATHAAMKLGLSTGIITNIGDDDFGKQVLKNLTNKGIDTSRVKTHAGKQTNHNYILRYRAERTILNQHHEYDYAVPKFGRGNGPKWIYMSSMSQNSLPHHLELIEFLKRHPETKLAFQPGTFQIKLGQAQIAELYKLAEVFFCNKDEAQRILNTKEDDIKKLLSDMHDLGPKIVVITDGPAGAFVHDGKEFWQGNMYPDPAPPVDRTGAGDSFSATFTVALAKGKSIKEALQWGPINSMSVVQKVGAQAGHLNEKELLQYLANAPEDYEPKIF